MITSKSVVDLNNVPNGKQGLPKNQRSQRKRLRPQRYSDFLQSDRNLEFLVSDENEDCLDCFRQTSSNNKTFEEESLRIKPKPAFQCKINTGRNSINKNIIQKSIRKRHKICLPNKVCDPKTDSLQNKRISCVESIILPIKNTSLNFQSNILICSVCCLIQDKQNPSVSIFGELYKCSECKLYIHQYCCGEKIMLNKSCLSLNKDNQICEHCKILKQQLKTISKLKNGIHLPSLIKEKFSENKVIDQNNKSFQCVLCSVNDQYSSSNIFLKAFFNKNFSKTREECWVHGFCAFSFEELHCHIYNLQQRRNILSIDLNRLNKTRSKLRCFICNTKNGYCIQCCSKQCRRSYHPMCARNFSNVKFKYILFPQTETFSLKSFCPKHKKLNAKNNIQEKIKVQNKDVDSNHMYNSNDYDHSINRNGNDSSGSFCSSDCIKMECEQNYKPEKLVINNRNIQVVDQSVPLPNSRKQKRNAEQNFIVKTHIYPINKRFDPTIENQLPDSIISAKNCQTLISSTDTNSSLAQVCRSIIGQSQKMSYGDFCHNRRRLSYRRNGSNLFAFNKSIYQKSLGFSCFLKNGFNNEEQEVVAVANQTFWQISSQFFALCIKYLICVVNEKRCSLRNCKNFGKQIKRRRQRHGSLLACHLIDMALSKKDVNQILVSSEDGYPKLFQQSLGFRPISRVERARFTSFVSEKDLNPFHDTILMICTRRSVYERYGSSALRNIFIDQKQRHSRICCRVKFFLNSRLIMTTPKLVLFQCTNQFFYFG